MPLTPLITTLLSVLTLLSDITIILFLLCIGFAFVRKQRLTTIPLAGNIIAFLGKQAILISLIVALVATLGSLFFSDVAGYTPCKLCWYQRILMYPMVLLLGRAYLLRDHRIAGYTMMLSGVGGIIALYHYYLQLGGSIIIPCSTVGYSVSCTENFVLTYGYITIPVMSLTAFLLIFLLSLLHTKYMLHKKSQ